MNFVVTSTWAPWTTTSVGPSIQAPLNTTAGGNSSMPWFHTTDFGTKGNAVQDDVNDGQEDEDETFQDDSMVSNFSYLICFHFIVCIVLVNYSFHS
jgi:hypothetical protein